jgi:Plavaka transposase
MQETYELSTHDVLHVIELQLANTEFDSNFDYSPYKDYGPDGHHVWTNLISGDWAYQEVVMMFLLFYSNL